MRLFVALMLGQELGRRVRDAVEALLGPAVRELRLPRAEGLHATLVFLGPVEEPRTGPLSAELARALAGARAPELTLTGAGAFPARGRERVLWVAAEERAAQGALADLHARVCTAVERAGFPAERRPLQAHVTVARPRGARPRVPEAFYALELGLEWRPREVHLVESLRGQGPSRYEPRAAFALG
jgi:2'-5' RNA ligase